MTSPDDDKTLEDLDAAQLSFHEREERRQAALDALEDLPHDDRAWIAAQAIEVLPDNVHHQSVRSIVFFARLLAKRSGLFEEIWND